MNLCEFLEESNRIEGLKTPVSSHEIRVAEVFLGFGRVHTIDEICLVAVTFQPDARLREHEGMDMQVGGHVPPRGGPDVPRKLQGLLDCTSWQSPWRIHVAFEILHPFTDCNGRTGRLLWLWKMGGIEKAPLGFLHMFYYQTLSESR